MTRAPSATPAIAARGLVRRFGDVTAVDGVSLEAAKGTCLALLGPNGAGKTTTIEMLEGLGRPDAGEISVLGLDWEKDGRRIRERIGVQLQETKLQDKLTVSETLRLFRSFYDRGRDEAEIYELVGLHEKRDARIATLSGGQKQRLTLGCALINRPDVLFLDEPTTGLDPQARRRVWEIVEGFKRDGGTVLLTTHYMEEAERLADHVLILDLGKVIAEGSPRQIVDSLGAESIVEFRAADGDPPAQTDLERLPGVHAVKVAQGIVTLTVTDTQHALRALLERGDAQDLRTHRPTLEDVFVSLTGRHLRDE